MGKAVKTGYEVTAEAVTEGYEYTAEQIEALHKFLGDEGVYELFGGPRGRKVGWNEAPKGVWWCATGRVMANPSRSGLYPNNMS